MRVKLDDCTLRVKHLGEDGYNIEGDAITVINTFGDILFSYKDGDKVEHLANLRKSKYKNCEVIYSNCVEKNGIRFETILVE